MTGQAPELGSGRAVGRRVLVSTSSQLTAKVLHLGLNVISTVAIVRYLGPAAYGSFVLVLTLVMLVGILADFGLPQLAVREISSGAGPEPQVTGTVCAMRLALVPVSMAIPQIVLLAMQQPAQVHLAALIATFLYAGDAFLSCFLVAFHVRIRQQYEALIRVGMEVVETAMVLGLIAAGAPLPALFLPPAVGALLGAVAAGVLVRRMFGLRLRFDRHRVRHLLREALPIGPALFVAVVYLKIDAVVLAIMRPPADVGLYGSAYQPIEYLFLSSAVLINVLFPLLAAARGQGQADRFAALYRRGTELIYAAMLPVPLVTLFVAGSAVVTVYGPGFAGAAMPLTVLTPALVLMTVNAWQAFVLLSGGFQRVTLHYNLAALGVAVVLSVGGIAVLGMVGAALATLGTALFVLVASTLAVRRHLTVALDGRRLLLITACAAATAVPLAGGTLVGLPWPLVAALGSAVYLALLARTGLHRTLKEAFA